MNRKDLTIGETYAYKSGKYGSINKVRIVGTEGVYRVAGGGTNPYDSDRRDGLRVALIEGGFGWGSVRKVSGATAADALVNPDKYGSKTALSLYDEDTEDGYEVYRVLPRYIFATWADHKKAEFDAEEHRIDRAEARRVRQVNERELFAQLPERYKETIKLEIHNDGSGGWTVNEWRIQDLVRLLIEEDSK